MIQLFLFLLLLAFCLCFTLTNCKDIGDIPKKRGIFSSLRSFFTKKEKVDRKSLDLAIEILESGNLQSISDSLMMNVMNVVKHDPSDILASRVLGQLYLSKNDTANAESYLYSAVKNSDWSDEPAMVSLIDALYQKGDGDLVLAAQVAQKALTTVRTPSSMAKISFYLGNMLEVQNNYTLAAEWYLNAAKYESSNVEAWLKASTLHFPSEHQQAAAAEAVLEYVIPNADLTTHVEISTQLGLLYYQNSMYEQAISHLRRAVENSTFLSSQMEMEIDIADIGTDSSVNSSSPYLPALKGLADVYISIGDYNQAIVLMREALERNPSDVGIVTVYADLMMKMGFTSKALELTSRAMVECQSRTMNVPLTACRRAIEVHNYVDATQKDILNKRNECIRNIKESVGQYQWQNVLELTKAHGEPSEMPAWWLLARGMSLYFVGDYETAVHTCSRAAIQDPDSGLVWGCAAVAARALDRMDHSMQFFEKALETLVREEQLLQAAESKEKENPLSESQTLVRSLGLRLPPAELEFALLESALRSKSYSSCLSTFSFLLGIPEMNIQGGGAILLLLSFVDWSSVHASDAIAIRLADIEKQLRAQNAINLPLEKSLLNMLHQIQQLPGMQQLLNPACGCLLQSTDEGVVAARGIASEVLAAVTGRGPSSIGVDETVKQLILVSTFAQTDDAVYDEKLIKALSANLKNPNIKRVVLLNKVEYDFSNLQDFDKIEQLIIAEDDKLELGGLFKFTRDRYADEMVVLIDSGMSFDDSLIHIRQTQIEIEEKELESNKILNNAYFENGVIGLSAWSVDEEGSAILALRTDAVDAWIFKPSQLPETVFSEANMLLGDREASSRLVGLLRNANIKVTNPSFAIHVFSTKSNVEDNYNSLNVHEGLFLTAL